MTVIIVSMSSFDQQSVAVFCFTSFFTCFSSSLVYSLYEVRRSPSRPIILSSMSHDDCICWLIDFKFTTPSEEEAGTGVCCLSSCEGTFAASKESSASCSLDSCASTFPFRISSLDFFGKSLSSLANSNGRRNLSSY